MKRQWLEDELTEAFTLTPEEHTLIADKDRKEENRLGFAEVVGGDVQCGQEGVRVEYGELRLMGMPDFFRTHGVGA